MATPPSLVEERLKYFRQLNKNVHLPFEEIKDSEKRAQGYAIFNDEKELALYKLNGNEAHKLHRYYLYIELNKPTENVLTVIMYNPSKTLPGEGFDQTVKNVIEIAQDQEKDKFSAVEILNIFSYVSGDPKNIQEAHRLSDEQKTNADFITEVVDSAEHLLIAWGDKPQKYTRDIEKTLSSKRVTLFVEKV